MTPSPFYVVMATAGQETELEATLASLAKCLKPDQYQATLVVENGMKHAAQAMVEQSNPALQAQYLFFTKGNKSAALNYALQQIPDEALIFFIDDDVQLDPRVLVAYQQACLEKGRRTYFGGPTFAIYEKEPPAWFIPALPASAQGWQPQGDDDYLRTPRFLGFNWAAYSGDIKVLGGFNENLGPGTKPKRTGQEWNMQERMLAEGFEAVYVEDARVWHFIPESKSTFGWFIKRRFQGGLGAGMSFVEKQGKKAFPINLIKYLIKAYLLLPWRILSLSPTNIAIGLGNISAGWGRIKGFFTAYFFKR